MQLYDDKSWCSYHEWEEVHVAAAKGEVRSLKRMFKRDRDCWTKTTLFKQTVLHIATAMEQQKVVSFLLLNYPSLVHECTHRHETALHYAILHSTSVSTIILEQLLSVMGNEINQVNFSGLTAFQLAIKYNCCHFVTTFLSMCPNVIQRTQDINGSVLYFATKHKAVDVVKILIPLVPKTEFMTRMIGLTPLAYAIAQNMYDFVCILADAGPEALYIVNYNDETPFFASLNCDDSRIVTYLLDKWPALIMQRTSRGYTALFYANKQLVLETLLSREPSLLFQPNPRGTNILHQAAMFTSDTTMVTCLEMGKRLLHEMNDDGNTPLHIAFRAGHHWNVDAILRACPNLTIANDNHGNTVLHMAVMYASNDVLGHVLEHHKRDVNTPNKEGQTPAHLVINEFKTDKLQLLRNYISVDVALTMHTNCQMYHNIDLKQDIQDKCLELRQILLPELIQIIFNFFLVSNK